MNSQRLRQIEEIFSRIVDLPAKDRDEAVRLVCGSDIALRNEINSLLEHADPPGLFLSGSALGGSVKVAAVISDADELLGQLLGAYRINHRIASGGMGTVYLAQRVDGQFDQQVAIKVVKRGMDSEEILNRFSLERRTLASLNHPRIARLFDGGATDDGRPYLVMEYVKGDPIGQFCDERRLNIDARLLIFCNVCDAVGFAHQNLVVHRDLKPGNILVDDDREPKLLDFGISKVLVGTGSTEVTIADDRRYTPEYASPEHVLGESLSTAADIYSLGVILYELLSGRQPLRFTSRSAAEIERVVRNVIPSPPSETYSTGQKVDSTVSSGGQDVMCRASLRGESPNRLRHRLSGDLDTIVLKAMHKDPKRRYVSVEQFAADIRRHLQGLPVLARPDTVGYRLNKFVRRHRAAVILSIGASMFILGGAGVAFWQAGVARAERDAANLARDQAEATADFFQQMLAAADPFNVGSDAKVRDVVDAAALRVEAEFKDRPLLQAALQSTIGRTYLGLGQMDNAEAHIRASYESRSVLLGSDHHDVAESEFDMARLLHAQGKFEEAEHLLEICLATHRRLRGDENIDTARVWNDLGAVRRAAGHLDQAKVALENALRIRERISGRFSLDSAETLNNLAGILRDGGDVDGALEMMAEVLETRRFLMRDDHPLVIQSMAGLAVMAATKGDLARAEALLNEVIELDRRVFGVNHPALGVDLSSLSKVLTLQNRFTEAEPLLRESYEIRKRYLPADHPARLATEVALGRCLMELQKESDGAKFLADALSWSMDSARRGEPFWSGVAKELHSYYTRTGLEAKAAEMAALQK